MPFAYYHTLFLAFMDFPIAIGDGFLSAQSITCVWAQHINYIRYVPGRQWNTKNDVRQHLTAKYIRNRQKWSPYCPMMHISREQDIREMCGYTCYGEVPHNRRLNVCGSKGAGDQPMGAITA